MFISKEKCKYFNVTSIDNGNINLLKRLIIGNSPMPKITNEKSAEKAGLIAKEFVLLKADTLLVDENTNDELVNLMITYIVKMTKIVPKMVHLNSSIRKKYNVPENVINTIDIMRS